MESISSLNRTAVLVADVEQSARFYTDVLGMSLFMDETDLDTALMPMLVGFMGYEPTRQMRFRFLRSGDTREGMVALFEIKPTPESIRIARPEVMNLGEACLVFFHGDLDDLLARAVGAGCTVVGAPEALRLPTHEQREMIFRNPDGTLFNIIERTGSVVGVIPKPR